MATITVSARGQMVIPAKLREKFGIKPHSKIECVDTEKGVALIPITDDPVKSGKGILKGTGVTTNFLLQLKKEELNLERKTPGKRSRPAQ